MLCESCESRNSCQNIGRDQDNNSQVFVIGCSKLDSKETSWADVIRCMSDEDLADLIQAVALITLREAGAKVAEPEPEYKRKILEILQQPAAVESCRHRT